MNIGITFPTKGRPEKLKRLVDSIQFNKNLFTVDLFLLLQSDDEYLNDYEQYIDNINNQSDGSFFINYDVADEWKGLGWGFNRITDFAVNRAGNIDTVTMFGDDMVFNQDTCNTIFALVKNYFDVKTAPDSIGCVSFDDGNEVNSRMQLPIAINGFVHKNWVKTLGMLFPESFFGDYPDNWLASVAKGINRYLYYRSYSIPHLHGLYMPSEVDKTYYSKKEFDRTRGVSSEEVWKHEKQRIPLYQEKLQKFIDKNVNRTPSKYLNPRNEKVKLSVLICSVSDRKQFLQDLIARLYNQITRGGFQDNVEILVLMDNKNVSVGEKRNILKENARGEYVVYVDDDDLVSSEYFNKVFSALQKNPDCVTYKGIIQSSVNNLNNSEFVHTLRALEWFKNGYRQYRTPNHINVLKKELVEDVDFEKSNVGEDYQFSRSIHDNLSNEIHINEQLYVYRFEPSRSIQHNKPPPL